MSLEAYIDDSLGMDSGIYVLAGYISTTERWAAFAVEWDKMLSKGYLTEDGKFEFKMSHMAMSVDGMARVPWFHAIINRHVIGSIAVSISIKDISAAVDRLYYPVGAHYHFDTRLFAITYNLMMSNFHRPDVYRELGLEFGTKINFTFDETTEKADVIAGWSAFVDSSPPDVRELYGQTPRFGDDREYLPLQAADFRAWWTREWIERYDLPLNESKFIYPYRVSARAIPNVIINITEDDLVNHFKFLAYK